MGAVTAVRIVIRRFSPGYRDRGGGAFLDAGTQLPEREVALEVNLIEREDPKEKLIAGTTSK
jgi:hypothetical protein